MSRANYLVVFLTCGLAIAQNPFEPETNIGCVERLAIPAYPPLARQTRVEGTVTASVLLSPRASVQRITTEFASKTKKVMGALIQAVENTIREASYRSDCAGKTVVLIYHFRISGHASEPASYGYPNKFWIVTPP